MNVPYSNWVDDLTNRGTCKPTVAQALVAYPQYCNGLTGLNENQGTSQYHSFQASFKKQFASGMHIEANYTFSKLITDASSTTQSTANYGAIGGVINPYQGGRNKALSPDDITHTLRAHRSLRPSLRNWKALAEWTRIAERHRRRLDTLHRASSSSRECLYTSAIRQCAAFLPSSRRNVFLLSSPE